MAQDTDRILQTALSVVSIVGCLAAGLAYLMFKPFQMPLAKSILVITVLLLVDAVLQLVFVWTSVSAEACRIGGILGEAVNMALMLCMISISIQMLLNTLGEWCVEEAASFTNMLMACSLVASGMYACTVLVLPPQLLEFGRSGLWCTYKVVQQHPIAFIQTCLLEWAMLAFVLLALGPMVVHFKQRDQQRAKERTVSEDAIVRDQLSTHIRTGMVYLNVLAVTWVPSAVYRNLYFLSQVPPALITVQLVSNSSRGTVHLLTYAYLAYYYSKKQRKAKAKLKVMNSRGQKKKFATIDLDEEKMSSQACRPAFAFEPDQPIPSSSLSVMAVALAAVREEKQLAQGQQ